MDAELVLKNSKCTCLWGHNPENIYCEEAVSQKALEILEREKKKEENNPLKYENRRDATHEQLENPEVGDCFEDMFTFWVYVVKVTDNCVYTVESPPKRPCTLPNDGVLKKYARKGEGSMLERFEGGHTSWVTFYKNVPQDVDGWFDYMIDKKP